METTTKRTLREWSEYLADKDWYIIPMALLGLGGVFVSALFNLYAGLIMIAISSPMVMFINFKPPVQNIRWTYYLQLAVFSSVQFIACGAIALLLNAGIHAHA